jgi:hypothetical protein
VNRQQLEHIIRAAGDVINEDEIIVVGSQAVLGADAEGLPGSVLVSREADVMARADPDGAKALKRNGAIGELTRFDSTRLMVTTQRGLSCLFSGCQWVGSNDARWWRTKTPTGFGDIASSCTTSVFPSCSPAARRTATT